MAARASGTESGESARARIAIVDYGGTVSSVEKAFRFVGADTVRTVDHETILSRDGVVLPGNLTFGEAMRQITDLGLTEVLAEVAKRRRPILGIGVGMQLFYESSPEPHRSKGLGWLAGQVELLRPLDEYLVPNIGSTSVVWERESALSVGLEEQAEFAHGHSYVVMPEERGDVLANTYRGVDSFVSAVERGTLYGVQFHPEKSREPGLMLLRNFAALCA